MKNIFLATNDTYNKMHSIKMYHTAHRKCYV